MIAALWALIVYRRNSRLEQARWLSKFYDKFYETEQYKTVRDLLDRNITRKAEKIITEETSSFTDYLNFFEQIAIFTNSKQLHQEDGERSFAYYFDCMADNERVLAYIDNKANGYEMLSAYLKTRK